MLQHKFTAMREKLKHRCFKDFPWVRLNDKGLPALQRYKKHKAIIIIHNTRI
jgi:hypothetical protein